MCEKEDRNIVKNERACGNPVVSSEDHAVANLARRLYEIEKHHDPGFDDKDWTELDEWSRDYFVAVVSDLLCEEGDIFTALNPSNRNLVNRGAAIRDK